jgi:pyruvate dehydrogenase E1 component beta subunit
MTEGEVPEDDDFVVPLGVADVKREGTDVTLVTWSHMVLKSLQAAEELAADGISTEVIDLRTLVPMDVECVLRSVRRTGRLVVAQEAIKRGGVGSDVAAIVAEQAFDCLRAPIVRVAGLNTPVPFNLALEKAAVPQVADIVTAVRSVVEATLPAREPLNAVASSRT